MTKKKCWHVQLEHQIWNENTCILFLFPIPGGTTCLTSSVHGFVGRFRPAGNSFDIRNRREKGTRKKMTGYLLVQLNREKKNPEEFQFCLKLTVLGNVRFLLATCSVASIMAVICTASTNMCAHAYAQPPLSQRMSCQKNRTSKSREFCELFLRGSI